MNSVVLASQNAGKLKEFSALLQPFNLKVHTLNEFTNQSIEETGLTFIENALIKARFACKISNLPALADDSGLVVPALSGKPGIYSARFAGPNANSEDNINKLLTDLESSTDRRAYFYCVLVYLPHEDCPTPLIATGRWHGRILSKPSGNLGFGYDPIFYIDKYQKSAAQLEPALKNRISHRAIALQFLTAMLKEEPPLAF
jgi:XTP/dITP diphosphohydrolase